MKTVDDNEILLQMKIMPVYSYPHHVSGYALTILDEAGYLYQCEWNSTVPGIGPGHQYNTAEEAEKALGNFPRTFPLPPACDEGEDESAYQERLNKYHVALASWLNGP